MSSQQKVPKARRGRKRVRKGNKNNGKKSDPNALVHVLGGKGEDLSSQSNVAKEGVKSQLRVASQMDKLPVLAIQSDRALMYLSMGVVLAGIRKGYMTLITSGESPYYAFRYLIDVLHSVLQGGAPLIQSAPIWLWELLAALAPKQVAFKTAQIEYKWRVNSTGLGDDPVFSYSGPSNVYSVAWGQGSTSVVNGYPVLVMPLSASYDQQTNGTASFKLLLQALGNEGLNKVVPALTNPYLKGDVSSFAVVYPEIGQSHGTNGALATTLYSEVAIQSPILSKFAEYQDPGAFYRGWHHATKSALSPTYVGCRMMEFESISQIRDKFSPILLVVNFDEFFYTLSTTLTLALESAATQNGGDSSLTACPLTVQDAQILLRQAMLPIFCNHLVQDVVLGSNFFPMIPLCVGPNGVAIGQSGMLLPTVLVENIRCCARRLMALGRNKNIFDILVALCRPANQDPIGNFTVTGVPTIPLLYALPGPEVPIDLIDMHYISGPSSGYVTPTGNSYQDKIANWNMWIGTLAGNLSPLITVGAQSGVTALMTGLFTRTQQDNDLQTVPDAPVRLEKKMSEKKFALGTVFPKKSLRYGGPAVPTYLDSFLEKEVLCNNRTANVIWDFLKYFILPSAMSPGQVDTAGVQAWQTFQIQPYRIPAEVIAGGLGGSTPNFPSINSRLISLAALDFKSANQQLANDFVANLIKMGEQGRGGFFASIAGELAGSIFPGVGKVVSTALGGLGM